MDRLSDASIDRGSLAHKGCCRDHFQSKKRSGINGSLQQFCVGVQAAWNCYLYVDVGIDVDSDIGVDVDVSVDGKVSVSVDVDVHFNVNFKVNVNGNDVLVVHGCGHGYERRRH